ncbi:glycosyltransferase [Corynebacterium minutissimum]
MFVGHTRFSLFVPDSAAWRASNDQSGFSADEYRDYLYDDERLALRADIFLNHTVPTLAKAAKGFDVTHIVSYSQSLPQKYKDLLKKAAEDYAVLHLDELPDGDSGWTAVGRFVQSKGYTGVFGRYRLDDDDVLSAHYFRTVEPYIKPEFKGMLVSMPLGIEAVYTDGEFFHLRESHTPMNSMGLLSVCTASEDGTITAPQSGPHDKSDRFAPVILDASELGYLRAIHAGQDNAMRHEPSVVMERLMENMASFPPFTDEAALNEAFPTVSAQIQAHTTIVRVDAVTGEGLSFLLTSKNGDATFVIEGESDDQLTKELLVSLWLVDSRGRRVPSYKAVEGFAASTNPSIGHFMYVTTEQGSFRTVVSLHLEHGYRLYGFRILGLSKRAKRVRIARIDSQLPRGVLRHVSIAQWDKAHSSGPRSLVDRAIDGVYRHRVGIVAKLRSMLGEDDANRVIARLDSLRKKLLS